MDEKSLEILEFPKVRRIIAAHTSFSASEDLALALEPSPIYADVELGLRQSSEARRLLSLHPGFTVGQVTDLREAVRAAAKGKVLEPLTLIQVKTTLAAMREMRAFLAKIHDEVPSLWDVARQITPLPDLERKVASCIADTGEVLDSASPRLASLRQQVREVRQRLKERLEAIIRSPRGKRMLQEPYIVERDGRQVLPVKVEMRKDLKGIVHDVSGSGATIFVEPLVTVDLGNELRQVLIDEAREVEHVLASLSDAIGLSHEPICLSIEKAAEVDLALAKGRYAHEARATEPGISRLDGDVTAEHKGPFLRLAGARHPLLKGRAVPLDVEIGRDYCILVITGPNAGGKTVALKTIGLLTLMAQAGIPIPAAESSHIPVFDGVFADIGDEQSIEQTLSSFTWHMGNISRIVQRSTSSSLVMFDELGTATEPAQGAALAKSILVYLLSRKMVAVCTTHYEELKVFAHATKGLQNASLDFDPVTFMPTYHLTVGIPGGSNAIAVASRLGLPQEIVDKAKGFLSSSAQETEDLIRDLMRQRETEAALLARLEEEKRRAESLRQELEQEARRLKAERQRALAEAREQVVVEAAMLQRQIRQAASELKKGKSREHMEEARKALREIHDKLAAQAPPPHREEAEKPRPAPQSKPGDKVWLSDVGVWGTLLTYSRQDGKAEVQVGPARLTVGVDDIEITQPPEPAGMETAVVKKQLSGRAPGLELDLRGKRADSVEPELDIYLNDAFLSHLGRVRIIHGVGTGTVRQIVRSMLSNHPLVKAFRPGGKDDGGDGVTVVEMAIKE